MPRIELFHRREDIESAAIRRLIGKLELKQDIQLRDVEEQEEALADLKKHGGENVPALWTGDELITGRHDIEEFLKWAVEEPFPELLDNFDVIANEVWEDLKKIIPKEFNDRMERVEFWIYDEIPDDLLVGLPEEVASHPEEICGLHVGTPLTEASATTPELEPVRIYLFRWAHVDLLLPEDKEPEKILRSEIAVTLLHEIGHFFGLSEEDLDRLGYG